jgi:RNA polymerase sigma factor (sigma-70 family)
MAENEIALLRQFVKHGDAEAFSEIVRRHAGMVYGVSLRMLKDESRAADVVQETFLRLLHDADRITDSLAGWLHHIATHKAIDAVRRDGRRRKREAVYAAGKLSETQDWQSISGYVDEAMEELDEDTRALLIQHFLEGRKQKDIAANANISQATVSRRIEAGVSELGKKLHNRGILVVAGALGTLLLQNAVEAAPTVVVQELGKMALVGATAAGTGAAVAGASGSAGAVTTGVLAGVKAKVVTAAAVAAVGVGGVVTYQQVNKPAEPSKPTTQVVTPTDETVNKTTTTPVRIEQPARTNPTATVVKPDSTIANTDTPIPEEPVVSLTPDGPAVDTVSTEASRSGFLGSYGGGPIGGYALRETTSDDQEETGMQEDPNEPEEILIGAER